MSQEFDRGFYKEFKRTPKEEQEIILMRKVESLEKKVKKLEEIIIKMGGKLDE